MHDMHLSGFDLNQLVALDALISERHVTRAARRVGLSQSAMSHALARLRIVFDDPLLVRSSGQMLLTPRAQALAGPLSAWLVGARQLLSEPAAFDPAKARGTIRFVTADHVASLLLPRVLRRLGKEAPLLDLDVGSNTRQVCERMEDGSLDLAMGVFQDVPPYIHGRKIYSESFACVTRRNHPKIGKRLTLKQYVALPHARIGVGEPGPTVVDEALAERGLTRRVAVRVGSFLAAPLIVADSDLVLTLPRRLAERVAKMAALTVHAPPLPLPDFTFTLAWHVQRQNDAEHAWVRQVFAEEALKM